MKVTLPLSILLLSVTLGLPQGRFQFANDSSRLIYFSSDPTWLMPADTAVANNALTTANLASLQGAPTLLVTLWGGASADSLTLQATLTNWSAVPGRWTPTAVQTSLPANQMAYFQVQIYDSRARSAEHAWCYLGYYAGQSEIFTAVPQSGTYVPLYQPTSPVYSTWPAGTATGLANSTGLGAIRVFAMLGAMPPWLTSQPSDQVTFVTSNAVFEALVFSPLTLRYQWSRNGTNLAGATGASLVLTNVQLADAGSIRVVVTNWCGATTSPPAMLQVLPPNAPSIRLNDRLAVGTVSATGSAQLAITGGFTNGSVFYTLDGSAPTTNSLRYTNAVMLTTSATIQALSLSADASQTAVAPAVVLVINIPPAIAVPPESQVVRVGSNVTFTVLSGGGNPPPAYQWRFNGGNLAGATGSSLVVPNAQTTNSGTYMIVLTNIAGSTNRSATLTVTPPPTLPIDWYGDDVVISYPPPWVLQWATNLAGTWFDLPTTANPYTNPATSAPQRFFRTR